MSKTKHYTIKTAAEKLELSPQYVRRAIQKGQLESELVPVAEGAETKHHVITEAQLNAWRESKGNRTSREDGRNKYTMYATPEEYEDLVATLEAKKSGVIVDRANKPKVAQPAE